HILGSTLADIASEKAGIIKTGSPVFSAAGPDEVLSAIRRVSETKSCEVEVCGRDFGIKEFVYWDKQGREFKVEPALSGGHQFENCALAVRAALQAGASVKGCQEGVKNVRWPGRLEVIEGYSRTVIMDCAHNPAGARALANYLKNRPEETFELAVGVLNTKDWKQIISKFNKLATRWYVLRPDSIMAADTREVTEILSGNGVKVVNFDSDYDSFMEQVVKASSDKPLVIFGSIYLVGVLRRRIRGEVEYFW
ncbi:MAG: hypothetical protein D6719_04035, partial [Candidatus Dadabacteria bacterium]